LIGWYTQAVVGDAGFTQEAFDILKRKAAEYPLIGTVVMDEMSIKDEITQGPDKRVYGHVDLGVSSIECNSADMPHAKYALVLLYVPIIGEKWKIPLGYFLIDSFDGEARASLVNICLTLLHNVGAQAKVLTFDGTYTNYTMCKTLGAELNYGARVLKTKKGKKGKKEEGFIPYFKHPCTKKNVYAYPDPCHMLKNVRNTFGEVSPLYDNNVGEIDFKYIRKLDDLQTNLKLNFGNKISKCHTVYKNKKMKVKLAGQVLSRRVSCALAYLRKEENESFLGSGPTAQFCLAFNNIFDMLNVKDDAVGDHYRQPINAANYAFLKDAALKFEEYIAGLRRVSGYKLSEVTEKVVSLVSLCVYETYFTYMMT